MGKRIPGTQENETMHAYSMASKKLTEVMDGLPSRTGHVMTILNGHPTCSMGRTKQLHWRGSVHRTCVRRLDILTPNSQDMLTLSTCLRQCATIPAFIRQREKSHLATLPTFFDRHFLDFASRFCEALVRFALVRFVPECAQIISQ